MSHVAGPAAGRGPNCTVVFTPLPWGGAGGANLPFCPLEAEPGGGARRDSRDGDGTPIRTRRGVTWRCGPPPTTKNTGRSLHALSSVLRFFTPFFLSILLLLPFYLSISLSNFHFYLFAKRERVETLKLHFPVSTIRWGRPSQVGRAASGQNPALVRLRLTGSAAAAREWVGA